MESKKIAFLGIGLMGLPMSKNLLASGHSLTVWNRSAEKALLLRSLGANISDTAAEAVVDAEIVISMLSDGEAVASLIQDAGIRDSLTKDCVWIDMSSTKPAEAKRFSKSLALIDVLFMDAPVSGGTKGAENASLAIMVGAESAVFERVSPVLMELGRPVNVGAVASGQLAKLANQSIVASTIGAVAEAMLLLEKGGANPDAVRDALKGGFADSTILQQHGARMTQRNFEPGGLSRLQLKDLNNVLEEAASNDLFLPMTEQTRNRFERYVDDLGGAEKDHSGLYEELLETNDLS